MDINTYETASNFLGSKEDRPLPGRSTRLHRLSDSSIAVRYHWTNVVTYHDDGSIELDSGGHHTSTTKARINKYSPVHVYQRNFEWIVDFTMDDSTEFSDGMIVEEDA